MLTGRCWVRWLCAMLVATMAERAVAGVVVNWGGDYFTNWNSLDPGPPSGNGNGGDIYNDPVDPTGSSFGGFISGRTLQGNFYNPAIPAAQLATKPPYAEFYGGHAAVSSTNQDEGARRLGIEGGGGTTADELHVDVQPNSLEKFAMMVFWTVTPGFTIGDSSVFSLASKQDSQGQGGHTLRWILREGSSFFISSDNLYSGGPLDGGLPFANNTSYSSVMGSLQWRAYHPEPNGGSDAANLEKLFYTSGSFLPKTFSNVSAVGFYVEYDRPNDINPNSARGVNYKITNFNANLQNAVPEPGTFLLGLAGFGGVALKRWRQRRKAGGADAAQLTEATT